MCLAQASQTEHQEAPDANEKPEHKQQDLPLRDILLPQETPVTAVRLSVCQYTAALEDTKRYSLH